MKIKNEKIKLEVEVTVSYNELANITSQKDFKHDVESFAEYLSKKVLAAIAPGSWQYAAQVEKVKIVATIK